MSVHWELEYPGLHLDDQQLAWTMKNVGDETAVSGSTCGEISIWQHAEGEDSHVDTTPWTNPLTLDRDVEMHTGHSMTYPLSWDGQQHGRYTAMITIGEGVTAEIYFESTLYGIAPGYR